ncbi:MAG: hypothetical protein C3L24_00310 [Candidatus Sedimenticola endophacoides]|uniref:Uncharacterized protein n=1 Tax=Candidatus Sedimenticola endophacoides TaxID=2548426 RepID=A0A6N4DWF8_9GAMM|nr:MAG: hypothetical protein C3L24_13030 [Candidatus Sedimenticola endophacoides]PUD98960.1 MAG: hypothetical protein C3L24_11745 [Candidatus Sedimenticola endophacoides]PUD99494.1 MAG: hypothetical protein C3L24_10930 [Candidatus Sedimenticola endophacoides]PUE01657.1 MAG: hypothetical protein C3L24_07660 [Candidatus Sedimenticola endophacoides]PUE04344.1 MAG: hypothetical protein C3L24_03345 [Candidatus Sedimenticola endophacoides]
MNRQSPPVHPLPWLYSPYQELSDQQVVAILDFLYELTNAFENRYYDQIHRATRKEEEEQLRTRTTP